MMTPLRLYVDPAWRRKGLHSPLLFPFWGNPTGEESLFAKEMFDAHPFDTSLYQVTTERAEADLVLAPYRHNWLLQHDPALLKECARTAAEMNKPLLLDGMGDIERPVGIENAYVLRIGGYRFLPEKRSIIVPVSADDLLERCAGGELRLRPRGNSAPVVGFAGWAHLSSYQRARTVLKELPIRAGGLLDSRYRAMQKGVLWRERALAALKGSPLVSLNLKERRTFSGSAKTAQADLRLLRQEFVDTLLASDYCLDVRGDANASTRLFEILSLGRIPVIVDTERNFPFSDAVDYRIFSLMVDFRDISKLPRIIADFHANLSPEKFAEMQRNARSAFVEHFRIDAQMKHIIVELRRLGAIKA